MRLAGLSLPGIDKLPMKHPAVWLSVLAIMLVPVVAFAKTTDAAQLDVAKLVMGLAGGLAVFLYGMELMGDSLKQVAGNRMKKIIGALSTNRFAGVATGATTTAVVQSSSVTTVMVVGFITAGLMTMPQALGVILGANIGTTITGQIIAFKVTKYAMWMVAAGFFTAFIIKKPVIKRWALVVLGLGLVFFGLTLMSDAMKPLRTLQEFRDLMASGNSLVVAVLIGAAFTALVQSSSATTGIVIVMAADKLIPLDTGIALALGANIGTCVTAALAAIGKPREAIRAALAHAVFNTVGVIAITPFIPQFTSSLGALFPSADVARQIANAHTIFNVGNTIIFLPFLGYLAKALIRLVPDKRDPKAIGAKLDESLAATPSAALELAREEVFTMADTTRKMLVDSNAVALRADPASTARLGALHEEAIARNTAITKYLSRVTTERMSEEDAGELLALMGVATRLRSIGNILRYVLLEDVGVKLEGESAQAVTRYHAAVLDAFDAASEALRTYDDDAIARSLGVGSELDTIEDELRAKRLAEAVASDASADMQAYDRQLNVIEDLHRVYHHASSIARHLQEDRQARMAA